MLSSPIISKVLISPYLSPKSPHIETYAFKCPSFGIPRKGTLIHACRVGWYNNNKPACGKDSYSQKATWITILIELSVVTRIVRFQRCHLAYRPPGAARAGAARAWTDRQARRQCTFGWRATRAFLHTTHRASAINNLQPTTKLTKDSINLGKKKKESQSVRELLCDIFSKRNLQVL